MLNPHTSLGPALAQALRLGMLRCLLVFMVFVMALPQSAGSAERKTLVAEERFVDNGDGTVTDTKHQLMWQKADSKEEVTFRNAEQYCKTLKLGGYSDWRLPNPDELDRQVVFELLKPLHSRDAHAHFDLYWSSDPTVLIPFNYRPSYGGEVSRTYFAREGTRAYVRAVRPLGAAKPESGG